MLISYIMIRLLQLLLLCMLAACRPQLQVAEGASPANALPPGQPLPQATATVARPPGDTGGNVVIAHTDIPLTKAQPESTLGNFVADAMLLAARREDEEVTAAICNYGALRLSYLPPGAITTGRLKELMPFRNRLAIVELPGSVLQELCDLIAARKGWPVSGISFVIKEKKASGISIAGAPLVPALVYKIAMSDYLARGGDQCGMLPALRKRVTSVTILDALAIYLAELEAAGRPLHPVLQKRLRYAD